jgi:aerobic-type carbon monoxide dehydrogenase small subunit (CoxS/CutS family)
MPGGLRDGCEQEPDRICKSDVGRSLGAFHLDHRPSLNRARDSEGVFLLVFGLCVRSPSMAEFLLKVNGEEFHVRGFAEESLLFVLRNRLNLTGTKFGCGEGQCGACTVLLNGRATRSCLTPLSGAVGSDITTIEGLHREEQERHDVLTPVQQAFLDEGAFQCGYCTPGMIMSATSLLSQIPHPTDNQIVGHMDGNICRCGTYPRIMAAIKRAAAAAPKGASHARA